MTTILTVPNGGTTLCGIPGSASDDGSSSAKAVPQAFRLDLEDGVLQNILRSARSGGKGVHVSFGKTIVGPFTTSLVLSELTMALTIDFEFRQQIKAIDRYNTANPY